MRKTKIICTLGPAVEDEAVLKKLMENGMDCARCNFSHGSHEEQKGRMDKVKRVRQELGLPIPILLDTKGPEIRLKDFENGFVMVEEGQTFTLTTGDENGTKDKVALTYSKLAQNVKIGTRILIDDGKIALDVTELKGQDVVCKVINGGKLSNHKSINIPNVIIPMPYISEVDKSDILFGIEQDVDFIAASFVRTVEDVKDLRRLLDENGGKAIQIISKIENMQGVKNLDEIIEASDGIMVARGDMGVEIPFKMLPAIQKDIIEKCYLKGKHVVTATQMLESMTQNPRPTRAEVSDVANAIYDGTTIIMLSGETAAGDYPAEAVKTMAEIAESTEDSINFKKRFTKSQLKLREDVADAIAISACNAAHYLDTKAIVVVTRSGKTADLISNYRPNCSIIAEVVDEKAARQLNLSWGVTPVSAKVQKTFDALFEQTIENATKTGIVEKGDKIIMALGSSIKEGDSSDIIRIHEI